MRNIHKYTFADAKKYATQSPQPIIYVPEWLEEIADSYGHNELPGRVKIQELYSYGFMSDEVAAADLLFFDDVEVAVAEKYGDKTDYIVRVLNREKFKELCIFIVSLEIDKKIDRIVDGDMNEDTVLAEKQSYIAFTKLENSETISVHLLHTRPAMPWMFKDHEALYNEQPVRFVNYRHPKKHYGKESDLVVVELPNGLVETTDAVCVAFNLNERKPEDA